MSEILDARQELIAEWNTLLRTWEDTRSHWRDPIGDKFEREHLAQWEETIPAFIKFLEELDTVVAEVQEDR